MYFDDESEHITILRDTLKRFVRKEMPADKVQQWDREHRFPPELFQKLSALGVCGLTIPEEYGGQGQDLVAAVAVIEELCRGGAFAAGPFIQCAFYGGMNITENGTEQQKKQLLPRLARGELIFAYGLSEPNVGGDLASVETTAQLATDGKTVIVNGNKRWCTGADFADYIYCLVREKGSDDKYKNLSLLLIPKDSPGISLQPIEHMNLRYTLSSDVTFEQVEVPTDNIVGGVDGWNRAWPMLAGRALDVEKIEISACCFGITQAAVEEAWEYAQQRVQFGKPISGHQAVRHALIDAKTKLLACRHMIYQCAWLANSGKPCSVESSMAKLFVAETCVEIVLSCQRVMGAYGLSEGYNMERHVRDVLGMPIVGGSSNMQRNNLANMLNLAG
jgi:alkylation response protein AidB-like acyl-CoA dehydrogenase